MASAASFLTSFKQERTPVSQQVDLDAVCNLLNMSSPPPELVTDLGAVTIFKVTLCDRKHIVVINTIESSNSHLFSF